MVISNMRAFPLLRAHNCRRWRERRGGAARCGFGADRPFHPAAGARRDAFRPAWPAAPWSQRGAARRCLWCPAGSARWAGSGAAAPPTAVAPPPPPPPARRTWSKVLLPGPPCPRRTWVKVLRGGPSTHQVHLLTGPHPPVLRSWAQVLLPAELSAQPRARARAVAGAHGAAGGATGMPERRRARAWPPVQLRRPEVPTSPNAAQTRRKAVEFVRALPSCALKASATPFLKRRF